MERARRGPRIDPLRVGTDQQINVVQARCRTALIRRATRVVQLQVGFLETAEVVDVHSADVQTGLLAFERGLGLANGSCRPELFYRF